MEIQGMFGVFYKISTWLTRLASVNILWFIINLPVIFFAYNLLLVNNLADLIMTAIIVIVLALFLFFPATTAMYAVVRKWVLNNDFKLIPFYWKSFKEEYKKSVFGGMIISFLWVLVVIDYFFYIYAGENKIIFVFLVFLGFLLLTFTLHFFSIIAHANTKLYQAMKNAMLITLGSPILTIEVGLIAALILYVSFNVMAFLIPFFMGALIVYFSFSGFLRYYKKLETK